MFSVDTQQLKTEILCLSNTEPCRYELEVAVFNQERLLYCTVPSPSTALVFAEYLKTYHTKQCSEINPPLFLVSRILVSEVMFFLLIYKAKNLKVNKEQKLSLFPNFQVD